MQQEAEQLKFEQAARLRDQIKLIENYYFTSQKVELTDMEDRDVIALALEEQDGCVVVFKIRDGKVIGRQHFYLQGVEEKSILIIAAIIGRRMTLAYVCLVALFSAVAGLAYGAWVDGVSPLGIALAVAAFVAVLALLVSRAGASHSATPQGT